MAVCDRKTAKKRSVCIGSLNKRIKIQSRNVSVSLGVTDASEVFTDIATFWADIETKAGSRSFNSVGIDASRDALLLYHTHKISIRKPSFEITNENWVLYKNERYKILRVEDLDESGDFLALYCMKKGDYETVANEA